MRCLGRVVMVLLLMLLLSAGWLYRGEISRYVGGVIDPMSVVRRTGTPSRESLNRAQQKVEQMVVDKPDSLLLTANELASLIAAGSEMLGVPGMDSITVELGNRRIRVRTLVDTKQLPVRWLRALPIELDSVEEVIAEGDLTPIRPGVAEWNLDRVIVRGLPLPADVVARVLGRISGQQSDGRLTIGMPQQIQGFRVRPEGVAIYRSSPK